MSIYNFDIPNNTNYAPESILNLQKYLDRKIAIVEDKLGSNDNFQELLDVYKSKLYRYPEQALGILYSLKTVINQIIAGKYNDDSDDEAYCSSKTKNRNSSAEYSSYINKEEPCCSYRIKPTIEEILLATKKLVVLVDNDRNLVEKYFKPEEMKSSEIKSLADTKKKKSPSSKKSSKAKNKSPEIKSIKDQKEENPVSTEQINPETDKLLDINLIDEYKEEIMSCSTAKSESNLLNEKLARYELVLEKIEEKIKFYEEQEIGIDDFGSDDTPYLRLDVLKKQFIKVWKKYSRLCDEEFNPDKAIRWKKIRINYSDSDEINKALSRLINKENQFPDYNDIFEIVKNFSDEKPEKIESIAKNIFKKACIDLKKRRFHYYNEDFGCHLTDTIDPKLDPASSDKKLKNKLQENEKIYNKKLNDLINVYAEKQVQNSQGDPIVDDDDQGDEEEDVGSNCSKEKSEDIRSVPTEDSFDQSDKEEDYLDLK